MPSVVSVACCRSSNASGAWQTGHSQAQPCQRLLQASSNDAEWMILLAFKVCPRKAGEEHTMTVGLGDAAAVSSLASLSESASPRPSSTQSGSSIVILFLSRESFFMRLATGLPASRSSLTRQRAFISMLAHALSHYHIAVQSRLFESTGRQQI